MSTWRRTVRAWLHLRAELASALIGLRSSAREDADVFHRERRTDRRRGACTAPTGWRTSARPCGSRRPHGNCTRAGSQDVFLEISPHPVLLSALREDADDLGHAVRTSAVDASRSGRARQRPGRARRAVHQCGQSDCLGSTCIRAADVSSSAPTYPWQRQRFWLDMASPAYLGPSHSQRRRRGVGRSTHRQRSRTRCVCEIDVSTELFPTLRDHRVHGSVVVPGATLLELVCHRYRTRLRRRHAGCRAMSSFHRTLVLDNAQSRTVQLVLRGEPTGLASFELRGLDSAATGDPACIVCWRAARWSPTNSDGDSRSASPG